MSLKLHGVPIPNNSLVDLDDLLYRTSYGIQSEVPTNDNGLHDETLVCVTDLMDCCKSPRAINGDWYYPDGRVVQFDTDGLNSAFRTNRGPNEFRDGRRFYGSVRLFRRFTPSQRGHFHCELPDHNSVNQILYVNIGEL